MHLYLKYEMLFIYVTLCKKRKSLKPETQTGKFFSQVQFCMSQGSEEYDWKTKSSMADVAE